MVDAAGYQKPGEQESKPKQSAQQPARQAEEVFQRGSSSAESNVRPEKKGKRPQIVILTASLLLCAGLAIFFMLNKNQEEQPEESAITESDTQTWTWETEEPSVKSEALQSKGVTNTKPQEQRNEMMSMSFEEVFKKGADLCNAGKLSEARKYLNRAVAINSGFADSYYYLGICDFRGGNLKAAKNNLQKYLQLAPNGQHASVVRGILSNPVFNAV